MLSGLAILLGASGLLLLSGCGASGNLAGPIDAGSAQGSIIAGKVYGGQQPVVGAQVYLFAAGTTGYGSAPKNLLLPANGGSVSAGFVLTGTGGTFNITGDWVPPAAPGDQLFLLAVGGTPGGAGGANANLVQLAALGSASGINSSTFVTIDEVTTVSSAYALAQYLTYVPGTVPGSSPAPGAAWPTTSVAAGAIPNIGIPTTGGSNLCTSAGKWTSTGPSTCGYIGLKNAFATVQNLVNISTGAVPVPVTANLYTLSRTPSSQAAGLTVGNDSYTPSIRVNTLADALAACVNTTGGVAGDGSNCGLLFTALTPVSPSGATTVAPTDTLQAILNLAQYPQLSSSAAGTLITLANNNPPFAIPAPLNAKPNDWTLALGFTAGGFTTAKPGAYAGDSTYATGLAIDQQGNLWAASLADQASNGFVAGFNNQGVPLSTNTTTTAWGGFQTNANGPYGNPAIDLNGNIYFGNENTDVLAAITPSGAALSSFGGGAVTIDPAIGIPLGVALDPSSNVYVEGYDSTIANGEIVKYSSTGAETAGPVGSSNSTWTQGTAQAGGIALDNNDNVWVASLSGDYEYSTSLALTHLFSGSDNYGQLSINSSGDVFGCATAAIYEDEPPASFVEISLSTGCNAGNQFAPNAFDGAGNLWEPALQQGAALTIGHVNEVLSANVSGLGTPGKNIAPASGYQGINATPGPNTPTNEPNIKLISGNAGGTQNIAGTVVDPSGNLWILNGYSLSGVANDQLIEFVGLAAPTVTPTALAQKYNTFTKLP